MTRALCVILGALLFPFNSAWAESDKELQEKALKARELNKQGGMDHSAHGVEDEANRFRGVFYGYLPCEEEGCNGLKMTLSLNAKKRYLGDFPEIKYPFVDRLGFKNRVGLRSSGYSHSHNSPYWSASPQRC